MNSDLDYNLRQVWHEQYAIYVTDENKEYSTLDDWLRMNVWEGKETKVWLGSTLDYHF
jgi:hypothetical protein